MGLCSPADLASHPVGSEQRTLALLAVILDSCKLRPGGGKSGVEGHFGLTTLERRHFIAASRTLSFVGKSGKTNTCELRKRIADEIERLERLQDADGSGRPAGRAEAKLFRVTGGAAVSAEALRAYLKQIGSIRPKDFRTYFANLVLVRSIRRDPPLSLSRPDRAKVLAAAYKEVVVTLNNTPAISKRSYCFTGFSVAYLLRPALVDRLVGETEGFTDEAALVHFIKAFKSLDWKKMVAFFKLFGDAQPFEGAASVLLITAAGSESIDLKRVRHVVLVDPPWSMAAREQVVGRARRFRAHAGMPEDQQTVEVHSLFLDGPAGEPLAEREKHSLALTKGLASDRVVSELKRAAAI